MNSTVKRRGKGVKPAMAHVNLRIATEVLDYYKENYTNYTTAMREALEAHVIKTQETLPEDFDD